VVDFSLAGNFRVFGENSFLGIFCHLLKKQNKLIINFLFVKRKIKGIVAIFMGWLSLEIKLP